jgi:hypothetical protein
LVRRSDGKRSHERPRHKWEENIKMDFKKWDGNAWTDLLWLRIRTGGEHL